MLAMDDIVYRIGSRTLRWDGHTCGRDFVVSLSDLFRVVIFFGTIKLFNCTGQG